MKKVNSEAMVVLAALKKQAQPAIKKLDRVKKIGAMQEYEVVAANMKLLKDLKKQAKEREDRIVKPIMEGVKELREFFKPFYTMVDEREIEVKALMVAFQENKQQKSKQLLSDFSAGKMSTTKFAAKQEELEMSSDNSSTRNKSELKITKPNAIPRKYLMPNEKLIVADLKKGKKISGCKLESKLTIVI